MANTLFIVDEDPFTTLPRVARDQALAEVRGIFAFVSGFKVAPTAPNSFPARIDMTDSVVRVVAEDGDVDANQSHRRQTANINVSIRQTNANVTLPPPGRAPSLPDRGGVGFQNKQVVTAGQTGRDVVAVVITGGQASLESARTAVVEFLADGQSEADILAARKLAIEGNKAKKGLGHAYFGKHQALIHTRQLMMWEMNRKPLADWPADHQKSVGAALGRIIAHEARHQYVLAHFNGGGLGADAPNIWGDPNFAKFDGGDETDIAAALRTFTRIQRPVTIHLETNPRGQPFPW